MCTFYANIGRVLNRFSKDIGFMDALLPNKLLDFISVSNEMYSATTVPFLFS